MKNEELNMVCVKQLRDKKQIRLIFWYLINLVFVLHSSFFISSCRSRQVITVPVETQTIVHERLVEVPVAADSSFFNAWLECDSSFNVLLRRFDEQKSAGMATAMTLNSQSTGAALLSYRVIRVSDTLYIPVRDSIIYKEIPLMVEIPKEVNRLTGWQHFQIWLGRIFLLIGVIAAFVIYFKK